jgi:hypothetical protein
VQFRADAFLALTENDADTGLVIGLRNRSFTAERNHLRAELGLEGFDLQIDHHVCSERQAIVAWTVSDA